MSESPSPSDERLSIDLYPEWRSRFRRGLRLAGFLPAGHATSGGEQWDGEIPVSWDNTTADGVGFAVHKVRVVLPEAFPFAKPTVIPLDQDPQIAGSRHQAPGEDGPLCLWLDSGAHPGWDQTTDARALLDRVREWFVRHHRNDWSAADRPPDLHHYFPATRPLTMMLVGDEWSQLNEGLTGRFGVWQADVAVAFAGSPAPGASMPTKQHQHRVLSHIGLADVERAHIGIWFSLTREPTPYYLADAMLTEIDAAANQPSGWALTQLRDVLGARLRGDIEEIVLALGYPDMEGERQWLFLRAKFPGVLSKVRWTSPEYLRQIRLESYETAPVGREAVMRRTGHTADVLVDREVLIFGQGAIGSSVSLLLAQSGVPKLHIVDGDRMRPGNSVRHVAGLRYVGQDKTLAVKLEVLAHVPDCDITMDGQSWDTRVLSSWVRQADVIVDATANQVFSRLLNEVCLRVSRPAIYAAAHRRAAIGRIRVVRPGRDACLVCYEGDGGYLRTGKYPAIPPGDEGEYLEAGCGVPTVQASAVDIAETSNWAARTALWLLRDGLGHDNHCLVVNDALPDLAGNFAHLGVHWSKWKPIPGCEACDVAQRLRGVA